MGDNNNGFNFDFMPKTDGTFIAPNEMFNSFTQISSNCLALKTKDEQKSKPEDDKQNTESSGEQTLKRKAEPSVKKIEKFMDFFVNQYKSDGFLCTLDENERQIYYCYYCHQYVNDFDLIQTHIDTSKHLNSILNGISFDRGLDKEFVIETISEKRPKNSKTQCLKSLSSNFVNSVQRLIQKELTRMPLQFKHYYFRNNIRLMDVMPPNAYFCISCSESIPDFKSIDNHLLTEKHILNLQKPSLMEMIDKTDDPVLKIGLQFITEERIADSSNVVYECEICNCFDCNYHKMFSHIKSRDHRINLLKRYDYKTEDLTDEQLENLIKEMHETHGSGLMKTSKSDKKLKTSAVSMSDPRSKTSASVPPSDIPKTPESESLQNSSKILTTTIERVEENVFLREDKFLSDFEEHKIIETYESDGREMYYCCYCDEYYNSFPSLERHIGDRTHKNFQSNVKNSERSLNQKFSMKKVTDPSLDSKVVNDIPLLTKHFYFKRGIKHLSDDHFYCRFCQIKIETFDGIEKHFESESHIKIEEIATKFNDLLFQTNQPIIGLKYIKEIINDKSKHILYECLLCDYSQDFCQMFVHLSCFTHQYRVLKKVSPNNPVFKEVKEKEVSLKSSELLKAEISRIEEIIGCGFVTKCFTNSSPTEPQKSSETQSENQSESPKVLNKPKPKIKVNEPLNEQKDSISPPIISEVIDENIVSSETLEDNANELKNPINLTEEELLFSLPNLFSVHLQSEEEASSLVAVIESLKDSLLKYYNVIPVIPKQLLPFIIPNNLTTAQSDDNFEVCAMEED